ncbi:MAG: aldehyde ferredoxin oxidoreductase family protein [Eubacteriales bacterium]
MNGLTGKILRVNLTTGSINTEKTPERQVTLFFGGRGLGAYLLYSEVSPQVDPLSPENKIIFANGPLAGTMAPGNNKVNVTFKSPLTNTYSYSLCGGHWGPELKFAGYDGLIIEGRAEQPVYLWIDDDSVEIRPAGHLWGQLIPGADRSIKEELGDHFVKVACIGPAGEKLNRMACITSDRSREFGRGGAGAVMGSKNLKAIAVRGTGQVAVARPRELAGLAEEVTSALRMHITAQARRRFGTAEMVSGINHLGFWSTKNFSTGYFEDGEKLSGPAMKHEIVKGDASCYACPVACGKRTAVHSAKYGRVALEGPEFENIGLLGANCGVSDWDHLCRATEICDAYGMDAMACGAAVSMIMEAYEKGRLTPDQVNGLKPTFGDGEALVRLVQDIGERKGVGDLLAEGVKAAADRLGIADLCMHVKGLPLSTYDPRGCKGMAITYATSPKGAHHMFSPTMGPEIAGDRFAVDGKGALVKSIQQYMAIVDSMAFCSSMRFVLSLEKQLQLFRAVTGLEMPEGEAMLVGERILNLERMYNVRLGLDRRHDTLPGRFTGEPMPGGLSQGQVVDMEALLDQYYNVMGWDKNGLPTPEKITELGLEELVK